MSPCCLLDTDAFSLTLLGLLAGTICQAGTATASPAEDEASIRHRYENAIQFLPWELEKKVYNLALVPNWMDDSNVFWYEERCENRTVYYQVDPASAERARVSRPRGSDEGAASPAAQNRSPDGSWAVTVDGHDLVGHDLNSGDQWRLTTDGTAHWAYGTIPDADLKSLSRRLNATPSVPQGIWSPDSTKFLTYRVDERGLYDLPYVVHTGSEEPHSIPYVHFQKTAFPGSEKVPVAELFVFDLPSRRMIRLDVKPPMIAYGGEPFGSWQWSADSREIRTFSESRDFTELVLHASDAETGRSRVVARERANLPLRGPISERRDPQSQYLFINGGTQVVLVSERDGWAHLYLFDAASGTLIRQISKGEWVVHAIEGFGPETGRLFFTAGGREAGRDPYYSHLYSTLLDGTDIRLLTPEPAHHEVRMSPDRRYFTDTYSTVAIPPVSVLRDSSGELVLDLMRADISWLDRTGWSPPIRFQVNAADGKIPIFGTMFLPAKMDESRSYPIVDAQYSGAQKIWAPRKFLQDPSAGHALAQLGFVVILVDGRGTPLRSQALQPCPQSRQCQRRLT